jgi:nucleotide-binding universal stress UspA family protein
MGMKGKAPLGRREASMSFTTGMKTIVVATDLHGRSGAALEYARKLAGGYGARIVLAHGLDPVDYASVEKVPGQLLNGLTEQARAALEAMAAELLREGIPSHSEIRQGAVAQMLVDVARQYDAGLIVIGTKGLEGAGALVVGAVAEQLVRCAPCPVMAVAADWNAGPFRPTPGGPVLLAMERNEATAAAVDTAYSLAETFQRPLLVLHARGAAEASAFLNPPAASLEQIGVKPGGSVAVQFLIKDGNPADAVAEAILQYHPSLLVVGVKRASDTPGPHGTAFALLARSRVPVVCVPPGSAAVEREACPLVETR